MSRRHVRIRFLAGRYYAEDLGSQSGTRVNGVKLEEPQVLATGDLLGLGPVVLVFTGPESLQQDLHTDPVTGAEPAVVKPPGAARPSWSPDRARPLASPEALTTLDGNAAAGKPWDPGPPEPLHPLAVEAPPPATERSEVIAPLPSRKLAPLLAAALPPAKPVLNSAGLLQAVVRSRRRREGALQQKSRLQRVFARLLPRRPHWRGAFVAALLTAIGAGALWLFPRPDRRGAVEGVPGRSPDAKAFRFQLVPRAAALLRYRAMGVATGEVFLRVNGEVLEPVPADDAHPESRELAVLLPVRALRSGNNDIVFGRVRESAAPQRWKLWDVALQVLSLPDQPADALRSHARDASKRATALRASHAGSDLFEAWKSSRAAWLDLQALDEQPELAGTLRAQWQALGLELDARCQSLLATAQRAAEQGRKQAAREALEQVSRDFPTSEHHCQNLALQQRQQHGL